MEPLVGSAAPPPFGLQCPGGCGDSYIAELRRLQDVAVLSPHIMRDEIRSLLPAIGALHNRFGYASARVGVNADQANVVSRMIRCASVEGGDRLLHISLI